MTADQHTSEKTHEREWDEAQEVSRLVHHLNGVIGTVRTMAERATRKGYDLDPDEVLGVIDVTYSPGQATNHAS